MKKINRLFRDPNAKTEDAEATTNAATGNGTQQEGTPSENTEEVEQSQEG
jgi:hypothetical protein